MVQEEIVYVKAITEANLKGFDKLRKSGEMLVQKFKGFADVMTMPFEKWRSFNKQQETFQKTGARVANKIRMMTHGLRGFRMEMLSVLFFGMAMQRMFTGLLRPALEVMGIFDLWRVMLMTLFIPILSLLMPLFIKIINWFIGLPEPAKKAIGVFVLIGAALGWLLTKIGMLVLGLGGVIKAFSEWTLLAKIGGILKGLAPLFSAAGVAILAIVGTILVGIWIAWQENFNKIHQWTEVLWENIKEVFFSAFDVMSGAFKTFISLITGDFEGFSNGLRQIWEGIRSMFNSMVNAIIALAVILGTGLWRALIGIYAIVYRGWQRVFDITSQVWNWITDKVSEIMSKIKNNIVSFFISTLPEFWNWGVSLVNQLVNGINSVGGKVMDSILSIFPRWARGSIMRKGTFTVKITQRITKRIKEVFSPSTRSRLDDFIWRPGTAPIAISPQDTIIGTKEGGFKGVGGGTVISPIFNTTITGVADKSDIERMIDENNKKQVDEIRRLVKI
jgi:phage-related protein